MSILYFTFLKKVVFLHKISLGLKFWYYIVLSFFLPESAMMNLIKDHIYLAGVAESGRRVWQLPYQYSRFLVLFASVCRNNT